MVSLETDRLLLRPFRDGDLDAYARMCGDPHVMRYIGDGRPLTRAEAWRQMAMMVGHWHFRGYGMWAVEERTTGVLVGRIGLFSPEGWPGIECGWLLAREHWGQGYATEGARRSLDHAFRTLGHPHVISMIRPGNTASVRVAERLGERLEARTELLGGAVDVYGISRADWPLSGERPRG